MVINKTKGINYHTYWWICKYFLTFSGGLTRKPHHCNIPWKNPSSNFEQTFTNFSLESKQQIKVQSCDPPLPSLLILPTDLLLPIPSPSGFTQTAKVTWLRVAIQ